VEITLHPIDKLTIDTPEQIALELPLAGIGSRFLALAIDSILQIILAIATMLPLILLVPSSFRALQSLGVAVALLIPFCLYWGYFAIFEIFWNGQTPGKRIAKIRVIKESGRPITPIEAIGRNLVRVIDMLPGIYVVGVVCMILNSQNKRLGDYVAGTVLVHDKSIEKVNPSWKSDDSGIALNTDVSKITPEELVIIETYLNRRFEFEAPVRRKTAEQILSMIQNKTGIERTAEQSDDSFIEAIARKIRDTARYR
jgi:uncharacterized RDD family membrane protein YckC